MPDCLQAKLDRIDELFPSARVQASRERIRRLWAGQPPLDRYPFTYTPATLDYYSAHFAPQERLHQLLDEIILHGRLGDDFVPGLFPGCSQATIPNMFGAQEINLNGDYTCHHILADPAEVARLPEPVLGPVARRWLSLEQFFLDQTRGRLPIHVCDMQGPADVAGQLLGYDQLFLAAYTDPDAYRRIMTLATRAFIDLWQAQARLLGDHFVGTHLWGWNYVPPTAGASLSADSLAMVSPDFYHDHYRPWLMELGAALGGLSVHSCGNFAHVLQPLTATPHVQAINAGQMTLRDLAAAGADGSVLLIAAMPARDSAAAFELIRSHRLRVDLNFNDFFVLDTTKPITAYGPTEFDELRRREQTILAQAAVMA
jgi:hypothetical protein